MNNHAEMESLVDQLAGAKSEGSIETAMKLYSPDIQLAWPSLGTVARGASDVEAGLKSFFGLFPDYRVAIRQRAFGNALMIVRGEVSMTPCIPGAVCRQVIAPVFIEFQFSEGRIRDEIFSLDVGWLCRQAGVTVEQLIHAVSSKAEARATSLQPKTFHKGKIVC